MVRVHRNVLAEEERLASLIADRIAPKLTPSIEVLSWRTSQLLLIEIYPSQTRPHHLIRLGPEEGVFVRVGSTNTLKLITGYQGRNVPTIGGLLLFGVDRFERFPDVDKRNILDSAEIRSPLPSAPEDLQAFLKKHTLRAGGEANRSLDAASTRAARSNHQHPFESPRLTNGLKSKNP